jgi:hypothetical protein
MKRKHQAPMQNFMANQLVVSIFAENWILVEAFCVKVENHHFWLDFWLATPDKVIVVCGWVVGVIKESCFFLVFLTINTNKVGFR